MDPDVVGEMFVGHHDFVELDDGKEVFCEFENDVEGWFEDEWFYWICPRCKSEIRTYVGPDEDEAYERWRDAQLGV